MPVFSRSVRRRLGAFVLLVSALPLVGQAPAPTGAAASARPAAWLRAQVNLAAAGAVNEEHAEARAAFDRALGKAQAASTSTLHDFLSAFLDAHASMTGAEAAATEGRSARVLVEELRHRLAQSGLTVRPPERMSAPPTAPAPRAWGMAAVSLLVPRSGGPQKQADGAGVSPLPALASGVVEAAQRLAAPVLRGSLARMLFAGRRLGP